MADFLQVQESNHKTFCRLMIVGKIKQALSFINNNNDVTGVHCLTDDVKRILQSKHPCAEPAAPEVLLPDNPVYHQPVIYEGITPELVQKSAMMLNGAGGPTLIDSDTWKHILCCKSYLNESQSLAEAIANIAKRLCAESIHPCCLREFTAARLIPLDKGADSAGNPGVRPIGIGEVLRRIIRKCVVSLLKAYTLCKVVPHF